MDRLCNLQNNEQNYAKKPDIIKYTMKQGLNIYIYFSI